MNDYRVRPRSPGWRDQKRACLAISVGAQVHEGVKLAATVEWIAANFSEAVVDVSDTLQRWTLMNQRGMTMSEATQLSLERGDDWLARNAKVLERLPADTDIVRWDRWLEDPRYAETHRAVQRLYEGNPVFRGAVERDATAFLERNRANVVGAADEERILGNSRQFIVEECAVHTLLAKRYPAAKIYPSHSLASLTLLRQGRLPGAPRGLENEVYVRINLERMGQPASKPALPLPHIA